MCPYPVSYTHLDVYKRQVCLRLVQCTVKIAGQIRQGGIEADKIEEEKGGA